MLGEQQALQFFRKDFIHTYLHESHSAWAAQGQAFVRERIEPPIATLFRSPVLAIQNQKVRIRQNKHNGYELLSLLAIQLGHAARTVFGSLFSRADYPAARQALVSALLDWSVRLQGKQFHGGENPD